MRAFTDLDSPRLKTIFKKDIRACLNSKCELARDRNVYVWVASEKHPHKNTQSFVFTTKPKARVGRFNKSRTVWWDGAHALDGVQDRNLGIKPGKCKKYRLVPVV